jgi:hypothetical protein
MERGRTPSRLALRGGTAMTRRTLLVPLFAAAFILAPSKLDGQGAPLGDPGGSYSPRNSSLTSSPCDIRFQQERCARRFTSEAARLSCRIVS